MNSEITASFLRTHSLDNPSANYAMQCRVAVIGQRSTNVISKFLIASTQLQGMKIELYEAPYKQINPEVLHEHSGLYQFNPEVVVMFNSYEDTKIRFYHYSDEERQQFHMLYCQELEQIIQTVSIHLPLAQIIIENFEEGRDGIFGGQWNTTRLSFINQVRRINVDLMNLAELHKNVHVLDKCSLLAAHGLHNCRDNSMLFNVDIPYTLDTEAKMSWELATNLCSLKGAFRKCLVLDLDNVIWGGEIGDDGIEGIRLGSTGIGAAHKALQYWALELKKRGILLAVCSKNTKETAEEAFKNHPEMVLSLDDISVFAVNWNSKAENLGYIKKTLNISFDAMVFVDDNPVERNLIRTMLPEVTTPELPEDPADVVDYLAGLGLFDNMSRTANSFDRSAFFSQNEKRSVIKTSLTDMTSYLKSLELKWKLSSVSEINKSRVSELSLRSNQFNLRTQRYTETDAGLLIDNKDLLTYCVEIQDRFGSYGLISVVVERKLSPKILFIENWFMSCRAIQLGVETKLLNRLVSDAKAAGYDKIFGEYLPTKKNGIVANHYEQLGFSVMRSGTWELNLETYQPIVSVIGDY